MAHKEQSPVRVVNEGLRAWLMETGLRLQATDLTDEHASAGVRASLLELLRVEAALVAAEEDRMFPLLMDKAPYLVCHFEQEHRHIAQLRQQVADAEMSSRHFASLDQVAGLRLAYTSYMAFVLQHGMREESILAGSVSADMQEGGSTVDTPDLLRSLGAEICGALLGRIFGGMNRDERRRVWNGVSQWGTEFQHALMRPEKTEPVAVPQHHGGLIVAA